MMSTSELPGEAESRLGSPSPDEVLEQLQLLLESSQIRESHQIRKFLDFIVRETLAGRQDGRKEYTLGCDVFGRRNTYDPRQDGIVRVQASGLRKRMEDYYRNGGSNDPVVIELPRGGYVPCFRYSTENEGTSLETEGQDPEDSLPAGTVSSRWRKDLAGRLVAVLIGCVISGLIFWTLVWSHNPGRISVYHASTASPTDFPELWKPFLDHGARNLIGFGAPLFFSGDGFYARDIRVNAIGKESDKIVRELARKFAIIRSPVDDLYTGVGELESVYLVSSFLLANGASTELANVRTVGTGELEGKNFVVLSSLRFQTILRDLNLPTDFEYPLTTPTYVRNLRPLRGEKALYAIHSGAGVDTRYAIVSLWPGFGLGRRILHIGGIETWGTSAATKFVLDQGNLRMLAREFAKDRSTGARGVVSPYFQILLRVEGRNQQSQKAEYVTHHYLSAPSRTSAGAPAKKP